MALGTPVAGGIAYSAQNGTLVSPAYPGIIAPGDVLLLIVGQKPSTANGGTVTTPSGWTLLSDNLAQGGYGTALAADTGNTNLFVYSKNIVDGTETGNLSVTIGTNNVSWAVIVVVPADGGAIVYAHSEGADTTGNASMSVTGATALGVTAGDRYIASFCMPTDGVTGWSAFNIAQSGITMGTQAQLAFPDSGTGNDIGGLVFYGSVTSGSSTAAPTMSATAAGTVTNVRGPGTIVRIREIPPVTGDTTEDVNATDSCDATATGTQNAFSFDKDFALELPPTPTSANFGAVAAVDSTNSFYVSFAASKTGQLGVVSIRGNLVTGGLSTTLGAAELWSFVAGAPNTLLATTPIKLPAVVSGIITYDLNVDFSSVSGAALMSGASYAIVFKGGTDWIAGEQRFETYACQQNGTGAQFFNLFGANGYTWKAGTYGTWGTSYTDIVPAIFAKYSTTIAESSDSTVIAGAVVGAITESVVTTDNSARVIDTTQTRTEAGSATDSQAGSSLRESDRTESVTTNDSNSGSAASAVEAAESVTADHTQNFTFASGGAVTEAGSATDSAVTARFTPGFLEDSNNIFGSVPPALSNVVSVSDFQSTTVLGPIFVAQASGTVKSVSIFGYRSSFLTSGSIDVQIWQLASNAPTALPQTLLGTATVSYREFNNIGIARSLLNISAANVSITAGTYYALILRNSTLSSVYNWANVTRLDNASAYNYSVSAGVIPRAAFFVGGVWNVSAGNDFLPATIYLSDNTTDIPLGISNTFISTSESLSATDSSDGVSFQNNFQDEALTATDIAVGGFTANGAVTETGSAADSETNTLLARGVNDEGGIVVDTLLAGGSSTYSTVDNNFGINFTAPKTCTLSSVSIFCFRSGAATTNPIITLEQNGTVIATKTVSYSSILLNVGANRNNFDLDGAGFNLVEGLSYTIYITATTGALYPMWYQATSSIYGPWNENLARAKGITPFNFSLGMPIFVLQESIATDTQAPTYKTSSNITEAVTATDSEDSTLAATADTAETVTADHTQDFTYASGGDVSESVTASDVGSGVLTARAWINEGDIQQNTIQGFALSGAVTTSTPGFKLAQSFVANKSGVLGNVSVGIYRASAANPLPSGDGTVELWQLDSNSVSGVPQTLLASVPMNFSTLGTGAISIANYYFGNVTLTQGVGYAIVIVQPSGASLSTSYLGLEYTGSNLANPTEYNYLAAFNSGYRTTTTGVWGAPANRIFKVFASLVDAADSALGGFDTTAEQTDSGNATDEQDSVAFQNNLQNETLTATDSEDSTAVMGVVITETGSATDSETNIKTSVDRVSEGAFINTRGQIGLASNTNFRNGTDITFIAQKTGDIANIVWPNFYAGSNAISNGNVLVRIYNATYATNTIGSLIATKTVPVLAGQDYTFLIYGVDLRGSGFTVVAGQAYIITLRWDVTDLFGGSLSSNWINGVGPFYKTYQSGLAQTLVAMADEVVTDTETATYITQSDIDEFLDDLHDDSGGSLATDNYLLDVIDAMAYADGQHVNEVAIDESVSAAEELFSTYVTNSIVNEAATVLDEVANVVSFAASLSESVSIQDACANTVDWVVLISESGSAIDSSTTQVNFLSFVSETVILVDYVDGSYTTNVAADEAGAVADEQDSVAFQNNIIDEPVDATDFSSNTAEFAPFITESGFALDTLTNVADRIADINEQLVSDTLQESNSVRLAERSETVNATDTKEAIINLFAAALEAASLEDVASAVSDYVGYVDELLAAISEASSQADMYVNRTEAESIFDAVVATYVINGQNLESVNSQDSLAETISYVVYSNNTAAANDDALATQDLGGYITETLSALDVAFAGLIAAIRGDAYFSISALARLQKTPLIDLTYLQQDSASSDVYVYDIAEVVETEYTIAVFDEISYIMSYVYTNDIYAVAEVLMPGASAYVELINAA